MSPDAELQRPVQRALGSMDVRHQAAQPRSFEVPRRVARRVLLKDPVKASFTTCNACRNTVNVRDMK